ncbi:MAG: hypothetical protein BMS9Abin34_474 [Patescibacteria group bacterium]|nr:MAG: hypothetical protein BMS9Abin34_474 [Patescibacteria group bacterium]
MFRAQRLELLESPRSKAFSRLKKFVRVLLFLFILPGAGVLGGVWLASWGGYQSAMQDETAASTASPTVIPISKEAPIRIPFRVMGTIEGLLPIDFPTEAVFAYQEPSSQVVDGLLTYGQERSLTGEEFTDLIKFLNADPLAVDEDTYYATFLASETALQTFAQDEGESLQAYLVRHVAWMSREFKEADPPIEGGLAVRRLIVLADGVFKSDWDTRGFDYAAHGLLDSDGAWSFIETYEPENSAYYNRDFVIDFGLLHEWTHSILHLPDHYALDYHASHDIYNVLEGIPEAWQYYWAGLRPGISRNGFAGGGSGFTLRRYSALQLQDRRDRGIAHDIDRIRFEMGFLAQVPQVSVLDFGPDFAQAQVLIYQSQDCPPEHTDRAASSCKILAADPVSDGLLDDRGRIAIGNLFAEYEIRVPIKEGVLFVKVINGEETWFRWMDIRDFNLAYWQGYQGKAVMRLNLASEWDIPSEFDWVIEYGAAVD